MKTKRRSPEERAKAVAEWIRGDPEYRSKAKGGLVVLLAGVIAAAEQEAADEATRHMREDMPDPDGMCVCGHDAADHCEPGCCGASCRYYPEEGDEPACRCPHFKRKGAAK